jgi:5-methyltetrahydrofolate--homocysteine methyltransferase
VEASTARLDPAAARARRLALAEGVPMPAPPFWGPRVINHVPLKTLVPYLNERTLYQLQWGYRKAGKSFEDFKDWARKELRPVLARMVDLAVREEILIPQAVYGYWKAAGDGDDVILFAEDGITELTRFTLPRQAGGDGQCIADFFRDLSLGPDQRDVIGLQVVTMGQRASDIARDWFAENRYQDYLYLHGLSVEMAEAMAEYVHKRIRAELGFGAEDDRDIEKMLQQHYRGSRYSFGYPACPNLEDQDQLLRLLGADAIGIELSDEFQLHPEQSTSAIVLHHPKAKYFSV